MVVSARTYAGFPFCFFLACVHHHIYSFFYYHAPHFRMS